MSASPDERTGACPSNSGSGATAQDGAVAAGENGLAAGRDINFYTSNQPAPPPIPRQLPTLEPCFLHRKEELAWLNDRLHPGKVAAVCGPGGMGKSALAAQAVHQLEPARFPDGIIFHSFYHQPKVETALQALCAAFQIEAKAGLETAVRNALSGRKALLILDGTEQADDLPALLRLRGGCGVLITSRKTEDALDELWELKRLDKAQAEEVFRHYSKVSGDDANVAGICKILDGWPVALRIAGRYLRRTKESAALLLRRSVDAVSADARLALGLAGCLAFAPLAREPVAAILDGDERRSRAALNELVTYGLLEKREERWQISHALIHTYARKELALSTESMKQLADWYIAFCKAASNEGLKGYARLDGERAHCLRLMESCLAIKLFGELSHLVVFMDNYLDLQGHWTEHQDAFNMMLAADQQAGEYKHKAWSLNQLGLTCRKRGEYAKALECFNQSFEIYCEIDDQQAKGTILNNIGWTHDIQGKYEYALQYYKKSLSIRRRIGDRRGIGQTLTNIAMIYTVQGKYEIALKYLKCDLAICRNTKDKVGEAATLNGIGSVYYHKGSFIKALRYLRQALDIAQEYGDKAGETVTCFNIAGVFHAQGNLAKAEEHLSQAVQLAEQIGYPSLEQWREGLARVRAARRG
ncbi:tetratricopeptide repeat protein [Desulfobulbus sp. F5]|nr:tetratricopeptide repeat protein [Desulfobulbus sp. F5]